jgi:hypothetical protein
LLNDAEKKRRNRAKIAESEGRIPGVNGRPPIMDVVADVIYNLICKDSVDGVFHDVKWMSEIVFFFREKFMYFFY